MSDGATEDGWLDLLEDSEVREVMEWLGKVTPADNPEDRFVYALLDGDGRRQLRFYSTDLSALAGGLTKIVDWINARAIGDAVEDIEDGKENVGRVVEIS